MNYIELINKFWALHEEHSFCTTEIAFFFYLLKINNQCSWKESFRRNNSKIEADLGISFNTMKNTRNKLQQSGVIKFSTKNGSPDVTYQLTLSKFDRVSSEVVVEVGSEVTTKVGSEVVAPKDKLNKTKLNQRPIHSAHEGNFDLNFFIDQGYGQYLEPLPEDLKAALNDFLVFRAKSEHKAIRSGEQVVGILKSLMSISKDTGEQVFMIRNSIGKGAKNVILELPKTKEAPAPKSNISTNEKYAKYAEEQRRKFAQ